MEAKICSTCKEEKDLSLFNFKNKLKGTRHSFCRACGNNYSRKDYQKHKDRRVHKQKERKQEQRKLLRSLKEVPCADCGIQYPYYVMDFDHREDTEKQFDLSEGSKRRLSISRLLEEASKCDIVCSNCHRIRTFNRLKPYNSTVE